MPPSFSRHTLSSSSKQPCPEETGHVQDQLVRYVPTGCDCRRRSISGCDRPFAIPRGGSNVCPEPRQPRSHPLNTIKTKDGVEIFYKDWGKGQAIVFSHGWPL